MPVFIVVSGRMYFWLFMRCRSYFGSFLFLSFPVGGMDGSHVVVYSAPLPLYDSDGWLAAPGYLYVVSSPTHRLQDYEIYVQYSMNRYPVDMAVYHGVVGALDEPVPARPMDYEVAHFHGSRSGRVDCYIWRRHHRPTCYALYEVTDISDPARWYLASRYVWRGFLERAFIGSRARRAGIRRFYDFMRVRG